MSTAYRGFIYIQSDIAEVRDQGSQRNTGYNESHLVEQNKGETKYGRHLKAKSI